MSEFEATEALVDGEVSVEIVGYHENEPAPLEEEAPVYIEPVAPALDIIAFTEALDPLPETEALVFYLPGIQVPETEPETPPKGPAGKAYDLEQRSQAA